MASPTSRTSLSSSFSPALTPRRSPRLAAKRSSNILTPVRNTLSFALTKEGVAVGDVFTLDLLKHFIEEAEKYAFLTAEVATADVGNNAGEKLDDKEVRLVGDTSQSFFWEIVFGCGQEHVLKIVYPLAKVG